MFSKAASYPGGVPLDRKWFHAKFHLGTRVILHYLRKLWPWSPRFGLARFQQNYVVEGLPPFTPAQRALAHEPGRCTGCGACDDVCPILAGSTDVDSADFIGPHAFVVAGARSGPHLDDIGFALDTLTGPVCSGCRACDRACPESIPVTRLASMLQSQRRVVADARTGTMPVRDADVAGLSAAARGPTANRLTTTTTTTTTTAPQSNTEGR